MTFNETSRPGIMEDKDKLNYCSNLYREAVDYKEKLKSSNLYNELQNIDARYSKINLIGEGAAKKIWLIKDNLLDRYATLAEIKSYDPNLINDFLNEARLASTLEHPSIAPVYDLGFDLDKMPFFIMKYYEGKTLNDELSSLGENTSKNLHWLLDTFLKICDAVSYAHSNQILHLDIKPSNIRINNYGEVLVCDWGISRYFNDLQDSNKPNQSSSFNLISRSTLNGEIRGTPAFMAPEQKTKEAPLCEGTDIYGLGALLSDMFTGSPPSQSHNPEKSNCPPEIKSIIKKATETKIQDRYETVDDLIHDIENFKNGMATIAEGASLITNIKKWLLRNRKLAIVTTINILVIIVILFIYVHNINQSNDHLETLVNKLEESENKRISEDQKIALEYYQKSLQLLNTSSSYDDFDEKDIDIAVELAIRSLEKNNKYNDAWHLLGQLRILTGHYQNALTCFQKAGQKSSLHHDITSNFINNFSKYESPDSQLEIVKLFGSIKDHKSLLQKDFLKRTESVFWVVFSFSLRESTLYSL